MAYQYMPKIFHGPHKNRLAPPPTYLIYGPLLNIRGLVNNLNNFLADVNIKSVPVVLSN